MTKKRPIRSTAATVSVKPNPKTIIATVGPKRPPPKPRTAPPPLAHGGSAGLYQTARGYRKEAAKNAIREIYANGITVSADDRDDAINGWLVSHGFSKVSRKTIQRAMKDLEEEAPPPQ